MKVKRFDNLWTMGLILTSAILVLFYIAKIFFPELIVGVAEIPSIVKVGNFIDTHLFIYYLCDILISFTFSYLYCCACARKKKLSWKGTLVIFTSVITLALISLFLPNSFIYFNYAIFAFTPFVVCFVEHNVSGITFTSTAVCFFVDIVAQEMSKVIRDITVMTIQFNYATFLILLIDTFIWRVLLYLFYNNKKGE